MIGITIFFLTLCLLLLNYIDSESELKFLPQHIRKRLIKKKKVLAVIFSGLIAFIVCIDWFSNENKTIALLSGQDNILKEITLTEKKKDSIAAYYTSKLEIKGEELRLAQATIRDLLNQLEYYNESTDEVIKQSYELFLEKDFNKAIDLLEGYAENATEERLIRIYRLKADLLKGQGSFNRALDYLEKLYYLDPSTENKFYYAQLLFVNNKNVKSYNLLIQILRDYEKSQEIFVDSEELLSRNLFLTYYYVARIDAQMGNIKMAASSYVKALELLNKHEIENAFYYFLKVRQAIGILLFQDEKYEASELILTKLTKMFEEIKCNSYDCLEIKASAYLNLANAIKMSRGDFVLALEYVKFSEEILNSITPDSDDDMDFAHQMNVLLVNKGIIYKGLERYNEAEQVFLEVLNYIPNDRGRFASDYTKLEITNYYHLADVYVLMRKDEKAIENFNIGLQLIANHQQNCSVKCGFSELKTKIIVALNKLQ